MERDLVREAVYQSMTMRRCMRRVPCNQYILGSEEGHLALVYLFSPFSPRVPAGERVLLLAATAVYNCEASTILEEPLGRCGKKVPWRTKNRAHLDAACVRRSAACVHPWSSCGDVMWRRWSAHHKETGRRKKWWRSCMGCRGTNVWPLVG